MYENTTPTLDTLDEFQFFNGYRAVDGIVYDVDPINARATVAYLLPSGKMLKETCSFDCWNARIDRLEFSQAVAA